MYSRLFTQINLLHIRIILLGGRVCPHFKNGKMKSRLGKCTEAPGLLMVVLGCQHRENEVHMQNPLVTLSPNLDNKVIPNVTSGGSLLPFVSQKTEGKL